MKIFVCTLAILFSNVFAYSDLSQEKHSKKYYQLKRPTVRELNQSELAKLGLDNHPSYYDGLLPSESFVAQDNEGNSYVVPGGVPGAVQGNGSVAGVLDGIIMVIDKLIAIGQKIIPTIKEGKPVVNATSMAAISVVPKIDAKDPQVFDMADWSIPATKYFKISYKNMLGSEVVSFVYGITYQYAGTYAGKGKYLAGVRVFAKNINVSWGFDLDASSQLIQISNVGSKDSPVAGATVEVTYTVKNIFKVETSSEDFFITGDGGLKKL
jgi:hypothetical protein